MPLGDEEGDFGFCAWNQQLDPSLFALAKVLLSLKFLRQEGTKSRLTD
jgi:hypothetical protein